MALGRQGPETVSNKNTIFFANGEVFFLTYFLIGASAVMCRMAFTNSAASRAGVLPWKTSGSLM